MGMAGLIVGCLGMAAGGLALLNLAQQGAAATPKPWTKEGRRQRVVALSQNVTVRLLDATAWSGMAVGATSAMVVAGGPAAAWGQAPGLLGVLQTLTLASSVGSVAGMVFLCAATRMTQNKTNGE